jgi:hypothetical protein
VRSPKFPLTICVVALIAGGLLLPQEALAQRRHRPHRVVVGVGYFPYYSPYYWGSFYGSPFWGPYGYWPPPHAYYRYDYASELRVIATPREAEVYVDGYLVGTVDDFDGWSQRLRLQPGEHEIELYLEGYRSLRQTMLFRPGETYKIRATLEKAAPGDAPESRPVPSPRTTQSGDPYPRRESAPMERRDAPVERRAAPAGFGTLAIRVQPADAVVTIDGQRWDRPDGDPRLTVELAAGSHRVEIQREGHKAYSTTVDVQPGEVASLNVSLPSEP